MGQRWSNIDHRYNSISPPRLNPTYFSVIISFQNFPPSAHVGNWLLRITFVVFCAKSCFLFYIFPNMRSVMCENFFVKRFACTFYLYHIFYLRWLVSMGAAKKQAPSILNQEPCLYFSLVFFSICQEYLFLKK